MAKDPQLECSFLIPIRRDSLLSDGKYHSRAARDWLRDDLYVRFGAVTLAPGLYHGFYQDPDTGDQVGDRSHRYFVAIRKSKLRELRALLAEACVVFRQKCIYLSVGGEVEFIGDGDYENG